MIEQILNISKYKPLTGCSYAKFPKESNHERKGLINIQITDDKKCLT